MATTAVDHVIIDTNVLLAATDEDRPEHARATQVLNAWPSAGTALYTSGQILREYLAVATRPVDVNGLGMAQSDAVANVAAFDGRLRHLAEDQKVHDRLLELLNEVTCTGRQVHDANIVATIQAHGVGAVVTLNVDDFQRFSAYVTVLPLASA